MSDLEKLSSFEALERLKKSQYKGERERSKLVNRIIYYTSSDEFREFFENNYYTKKDLEKTINKLYYASDPTLTVKFFRNFPYVVRDLEPCQRQKLISKVAQSSYACSKFLLAEKISAEERAILIAGLAKSYTFLEDFSKVATFSQEDSEVIFNVIMSNVDEKHDMMRFSTYFKLFDPQGEKREMILKKIEKSSDASIQFIKSKNHTPEERKRIFKSAIRNYESTYLRLLRTKFYLTKDEKQQIFQKHKLLFVKTRNKLLEGLNFKWIYETFKDVMTKRDLEYIVEYVLADKTNFEVVKEIFDFNKDNILGLSKELRDKFDAYAAIEVLTYDQPMSMIGK